MTISTQIKHPWRTTVRSAFQAVVAIAPLAAPLYFAATHNDPALATGIFGAMIAIAAAVTRIMALPGVDAFLTQFVPFLATQPAATPVFTVGNPSAKVTTTPPSK